MWKPTQRKLKVFRGHVSNFLSNSFNWTPNILPSTSLLRASYLLHILLKLDQLDGQVPASCLAVTRVINRGFLAYQRLQTPPDCRNRAGIADRSLRGTRDAFQPGDERFTASERLHGDVFDFIPGGLKLVCPQLNLPVRSGEPLLRNRPVQLLQF